MPGTLYVVATPIGNLEDITLRALRVLGEVTLVAAEDTRRTGNLLRHYKITTPTTSLHEHNEHRKVPQLLARLVAGADIALVTDAGTPTISDPGALLVAEALKRSLPVHVVPGPSAVMTALACSGLQADTFVFVGFPPSKTNERGKWLRKLANEERLLVLFEAPHRIVATLTQALEVMGDREIVLARELTKLHEEVARGSISDVLPKLAPARGEYTLIIQPEKRDGTAVQAPISDSSLLSEFGRLTELGSFSRRQAILDLATRHGLPARTVYRSIENAKKIGQTT